MTTTEQLEEAIAALEAQLGEDPTIGALREALDGCGPRTQIPIRTADLLEDFTPQTRSLSLAAPTPWFGLRG